MENNQNTENIKISKNKIIDPEKVKDNKKRYYQKNKEKISKKSKEKYQENKDKIYKKNKKWRDNNSDQQKKYKEIYNKEYKEKNKEYFKEYYKQNKEKIKEIQIKNKDKNKENQRIYSKNRRKNDPLFKLSGNIRRMISRSFYRNGFKKNSKTNKIIGCTFEELKTHIESMFESWMTWENYGLYNGELNYGWDIDHILPISLANNEDEVIKLGHYLNLQPLCSKINRDIKINRITSS